MQWIGRSTGSLILQSSIANLSGAQEMQTIWRPRGLGIAKTIAIEFCNQGLQALRRGVENCKPFGGPRAWGTANLSVAKDLSTIRLSRSTQDQDRLENIKSLGGLEGVSFTRSVARQDGRSFLERGDLELRLCMQT